MPEFLPLTAVFLVGAVVGSFLNKCIERLPFEKSFLWPGSRCRHCCQPIAWRDSIPLMSYWLCRGRCRTCAQPFSVRYFAIELLTAGSFVVLYYLEVVENIHDFNVPNFTRAAHTIFSWHTLLFCFLLVATFVDIDHYIIPLPLTIAGTLVGLVGSMLWPWPWPYSPAVAEGMNHWMTQPIPRGLYPWPVWGPLPSWLPPGSPWLGLATGVAGTLMGTLALRVVRICFGIGMGPDYMDDEDPQRNPRTLLGRGISWLQRVGGKTMGLGDADLMMMAGAFLGWQPVLISFFVATFPGLFFGIAQMILRPEEPPTEKKAGEIVPEETGGYHQLPFGPALAIGVVLTFLFWEPLGERVQLLLFFPEVLIGMTVVVCVLMVVAGFGLRLLRTRGE